MVVKNSIISPKYNKTPSTNGSDINIMTILCKYITQHQHPQSILCMCIVNILLLRVCTSAWWPSSLYNYVQVSLKNAMAEKWTFFAENE